MNGRAEKEEKDEGVMRFGFSRRIVEEWMELGERGDVVIMVVVNGDTVAVW